MSGMRDVTDPDGPISVTPAELKMLDALIELEKEERAGAVESVTIYDPDGVMAFWAKAGKWAWKNRYKLLAAGQAVMDLATGVVAPVAGDVRDSRAVGQLAAVSEEPTLDELLAAREHIYRAMSEQRTEAAKKAD